LSVAAAPVVDEVVEKAQQFFKDAGVLDETEEVVETAQNYATGVTQSFRNFIDVGPKYLTEFKKQYVFPVNQNYRNIGHAGFTVAFLLASLKFRRGVFVSLKNTAVAAVVSGLVFNPEPFNPFLKKSFFYQGPTGK